MTSRKMTEPAPNSKRAPLRTLRDMTRVVVPGLLALIIGMVIAFQFVEPAPPKEFTLATGGTGGAYHRFGGDYRQALARDRIAVTLRSTSGSIENIALLADPASGVTAAFVQGGTSAGKHKDELVTLASIYFEPVWVFHRGQKADNRLASLKGKRIAIGRKGSGTRKIAQLLAGEAGLTTPETTFLPLGGKDAKQALLAGKVDAAFFVAGPGAPVVRELATSDGIHLMDFSRAEAFTRRHAFLSTVRLPEGVLDPATNRPNQDKMLLAPTANLVARKDIHPGLVFLLLRAATTIHGGHSILSNAGTFPSTRFAEFEIPAEAQNYIAKGAGFLHRVLPFWAASLVDQLAILLVPLITVLLPLFKILPPAYRWRVRKRIIRWYRDLGELETALESAIATESEEQRARQIDRLNHIEEDVRQINVPLGYADALYNLRLHIALVRNRLEGQTERSRLNSE